MREKRRLIRFPISVKVVYTLQKDPKVEKTGVGRDISAGGIQLVTNEKLEVGSKMEFKLFVPDALNPAHLKGTVVWTREQESPKGISYFAGVDFGKIEEDNKNTFLKFLCSLMYEKTEQGY